MRASDQLGGRGLPDRALEAVGDSLLALGVKMRICEPGGQGVVTARIFTGVGVLATALLVGGCANQQSASGLPRGSDGCTNSGFLVNPQYTRSNGQMAPRSRSIAMSFALLEQGPRTRLK